MTINCLPWDLGQGPSVCSSCASWYVEELEILLLSLIARGARELRSVCLSFAGSMSSHPNPSSQTLGRWEQLRSQSLLPGRISLSALCQHTGHHHCTSGPLQWPQTAFLLCPLSPPVPSPEFISDGVYVCSMQLLPHCPDALGVETRVPL